VPWLENEAWRGFSLKSARSEGRPAPGLALLVPLKVSQQPHGERAGDFNRHWQGSRCLGHRAWLVIREARPQWAGAACWVAAGEVQPAFDESTARSVSQRIRGKKCWYKVPPSSP